MKKGSKKCCICKNFTEEPKFIYVGFYELCLCFICYIHLLSFRYNKLESIKKVI